MTTPTEYGWNLFWDIKEETTTGLKYLESKLSTESLLYTELQHPLVKFVNNKEYTPSKTDRKFWDLSYTQTPGTTARLGGMIRFFVAGFQHDNKLIKLMKENYFPRTAVIECTRTGGPTTYIKTQSQKIYNPPEFVEIKKGEQPTLIDYKKSMKILYENALTIRFAINELKREYEGTIYIIVFCQQGCNRSVSSLLFYYLYYHDPVYGLYSGKASHLLSDLSNAFMNVTNADLTLYLHYIYETQLRQRILVTTTCHSMVSGNMEWKGAVTESGSSKGFNFKTLAWNAFIYYKRFETYKFFKGILDKKLSAYQSLCEKISEGIKEKEKTSIEKEFIDILKQKSFNMVIDTLDLEKAFQNSELAKKQQTTEFEQYLTVESYTQTLTRLRPHGKETSITTFFRAEKETEFPEEEFFEKQKEEKSSITSTSSSSSDISSTSSILSEKRKREDRLANVKKNINTANKKQEEGEKEIELFL